MTFPADLLHAVKIGIPTSVWI